MSNKRFKRERAENENVEVVETETTEVEAVEEVVEPEVKEEKPVGTKIGVVSSCGRLNVRRTPEAAGDVVTTIPLGATVTIDVRNSKKDFYKVILADGTEGFCMKDYITASM